MRTNGGTRHGDSHGGPVELGCRSLVSTPTKRANEPISLGAYRSGSGGRRPKLRLWAARDQSPFLWLGQHLDRHRRCKQGSHCRGTCHLHVFLPHLNKEGKHISRSWKRLISRRGHPALILALESLLNLNRGSPSHSGASAERKGNSHILQEVFHMLCYLLEMGHAVVQAARWWKSFDGQVNFPCRENWTFSIAPARETHLTCELVIKKKKKTFLCSGIYSGRGSSLQ